MKADFDAAAQHYDASFTDTLIGKLQRDLVYNRLSCLLSNSKTTSVLEVNCGTGADALWLAEKGFKVMATDISSAMIEVAKTKENPNSVAFNQADINKIEQYFGSEKFDLIFSNFGGLNCLSEMELRFFFKNAANLLTENGLLILVIMPRNTLWEHLYFCLKGKFQTAFRRHRESVIANVDGEKVTTYYYNPKEILPLAERYFKFEQQNPIGFFVPPSYLEPFFKNKPRWAKFLAGLEQKITRFSFLAKYADHYLIAFNKK